jgi:hypothetical protein
LSEQLKEDYIRVLNTKHQKLNNWVCLML